MCADPNTPIIACICVYVSTYVSVYLVIVFADTLAVFVCETSCIYVYVSKYVSKNSTWVKFIVTYQKKKL